MQKPPDLNRAICILASALLWILQLVRTYLVKIHPQNESLQRVDEMISELSEIHQQCWIKPMD